MIICMDYSNDGERYIAFIQYTSDWGNETVKAVAEHLSLQYDEVYVMGFNCNCKELIEEVVLKGCRI